MKRLLHSLVLLLTLSLLSGCVGAIIAGAATGGLVIYDRRSIKSAATDQSIRHKIYKEFAADPDINNSNIVVSSFEKSVLIAGQTPYDSTRIKAERIVSGIPGIKRIYNEVIVAKPVAAKVHAKDAWITTKIKSQMLTKSGLRSGTIKVVTENNNVYLMGHVTKEQADLAVDVARRVEGVKKVVKVFEYKSLATV